MDWEHVRPTTVFSLDSNSAAHFQSPAKMFGGIVPTFAEWTKAKEQFTNHVAVSISGEVIFATRKTLARLFDSYCVYLLDNNFPLPDFPHYLDKPESDESISPMTGNPAQIPCGNKSCSDDIFDEIVAPAISPRLGPQQMPNLGQQNMFLETNNGLGQPHSGTYGQERGGSFPQIHFVRAESSSRHGSYQPPAPQNSQSVAFSTSQNPQISFETTSPLDHPANFAAQESATQSIPIVQSGTQFSVPTSDIKHLEKRNARLTEENTAMKARLNAFEKLFMAGSMGLNGPQTTGDNYMDSTSSNGPSPQCVDPQGTIQVSEEMRRIHRDRSNIPQEMGSTYLQDVDCWDYSWAPSLDAQDVTSIERGGRITPSCLKFLLAKNVAKREGLILLGPLYFQEWTNLPARERSIVPKCFEQSSLDIRAQMILLPIHNGISVIGLCAVSRSALGISSIYCYSLSANANTIFPLTLSFFGWFFQSTSLRLQPLISPEPRTSLDAEIHLILSAMTLADLHSSGKLPQNITDGQDPNDIISFREHALTQLRPELASPQSSIASVPQPVTKKRTRDLGHLANNQRFRFVEFESDHKRKRHNQVGDQPRRSGPMSDRAVAELRKVRKRGGACNRCKTLKKKCDGNDPCNQCQKLDQSKTSKWREPCMRVYPSLSKGAEHFGGEAVERERREGRQNSVVEDHSMEAGLTISQDSTVGLYDELQNAIESQLDDDFDIHCVEKVIDLILSSKPSANFNDALGYNALILSLIHNHIKLASVLLEHNAPMVLEHEVFQPIYAAARDGKLDFVHLFLRHGANTSTPNDAGNCPLHTSIDRHHAKISELLVKQVATLTSDDLQTAGWTELHRAIMEGDEAKVHNALKSERSSGDTSIESVDSAGWTVLRWAAWKGDVGIFKLLVEAGADLMSTDSESRNLLHFAGEYGSSSIVRFLVQGDKIPLHERDDSESNAFHFAAKSNDTRTVQILLDNEIPIHGLDKWARSPLYNALCAGNASVAFLLLRHGVRTHQTEKNALLQAAAKTGLVGVLAILLERGLDINDFGDVDGVIATPLIHAIMAGKVDSVRLLLQHEAKPNLKDESGSRAIHHAARSGSLGVFKLLLNSKDIDCAAENSDGKTARAIALKEKFFCIVKLLGYNGVTSACECRCCKGLEEDLDLASADDSDSALEMTKKLFLSARIGDVDTVQKLLHLVVSVSARRPDETEDTALHMAARNGHETIAMMLLDAGADYEAVDKDGMSPLHNSILSGRPSVVAALLAAGAKVNARTRLGETALILAVKNDRIDCVQLLLEEEDIDVNLVDRSRKSALVYAIRCGNQTVIDVLLNVPGIDVDPSTGWMTPLQQAVNNGDKGAIEALFNAGANPNEKGDDFDVNIPLVVAAGVGDVSMVATLIDASNTDVNARDPRTGQIALIEASKRSRKEVVSFLLQQPGIDVNARDLEENTALSEAIWNEASEVVALLLQVPGIKVKSSLPCGYQW